MMPSIPSRLQRVLAKEGRRADADRWHLFELDAELDAFNALTQPHQEQTR